VALNVIFVEFLDIYGGVIVMFIMGADGEFGDGELTKLCELLELLDQKLYVIHTLISQSRDPDSDGLCDKGEYFIGVGFAAIQQYLVDTLFYTGLNKRDAFKLGPVHSGDLTFIDLFNSAANWWKHEAEWYKYYNNKVILPKDVEKTFDDVKAATGNPENDDYAISCVLASICGSSNPSLAAVVPYLIKWRAAVHQKSKHKP
jgi:hypothetical protein